MSRWKLAYHANCWGPLGGNAVGVTSITQLTYKTFGDMTCAAPATSRRPVTRASSSSTATWSRTHPKTTPRRAGSSRKRSLRWLPSIAARTSSTPTSLTRSWRVSPGPPMRRRRSGPNTSWSVAARATLRRNPDRRLRRPRRSARQGSVDRRRRAGCAPSYHPHLSTIVENPDEVRTIFDKTRIGFCPDTAHLAAAGGDAAVMVREHASRISYVHLKGWQREPFAFTPGRASAIVTTAL